MSYILGAIISLPFIIPMAVIVGAFALVSLIPMLWDELGATHNG